MRQAKESQLQLAEYRRATYQLEVPAGVTLDDVVQPAYWCNIAGRLKRNDRIEVVSEDAKWRADLAVESVGRLAARVTVMHAVDHGADAPAETGDSRYDVQWAGPKHKWRVLRKADGEVMSHGYTSQEEAWNAVPAMDQLAA